MEIVIKHLLKKYNQKTVLDIPHLHVRKGQITGLLGDNGCGKSTLLKIIGGLDFDYEGEVLYDSLHFKKENRQIIGMVSQNPYLFKRSVYENIEYPLKVRGIEKDKRKEIVNQFLQNMYIEGISSQRADTLSGGEAQKVALARVLAAAPKILLLDETTSNIHEEAVLIIEKELKAYHQSTGCTIIFVTHNQAQAKRFCGACIHLDLPRK
ncbi:ATP-binding cassette domain-containing protein [Cellulosilyticum sp. I15G10I2]|uniref:ATP-binding cassette domain-containing protein n=1 Tax=Cellulosilyticum sp. I15G10I2 TaxID=1892843 RepID=UPI00085C0422|nr:ATP-binding cassette domain-containing protein [Cellulosilyticum sp. I15G10I2]